MKTILCAALMALVCAGGFVEMGRCANTSVTPENTVTTTVGGAARAAFHFDISHFADIDLDAGRSVYFEWTLSGIPSKERSEYTIFAPEVAWEDARDVGELELNLSVDTWDIEVRDYNRAGGFVRLNVTEVVKAWLGKDQPNEGLVFTTDAVSANSLGGQASGARLVLR